MNVAFIRTTCVLIALLSSGLQAQNLDVAAARPRPVAAVPAAVQALDSALVLGRGPQGQVMLGNLREAAAQHVKAEGQQAFWQSPAAVGEMASSLYRQQVLAAKARALNLKVQDAQGMTETSRTTELVSLYLAHRVTATMPKQDALERFAKAQYDQDPKGHVHGEIYRVSHILVTAVPGARTEAQALERVQEVLDRLRGGEEFGQVAKQMSDDRGSRDNQGSLAFREASELPADFVTALQGMTVGEVSQQAVKTAAGYHVIWLQEKRPPGRLAFSDLRDHLMERAAQQIEARTRSAEWADAGAGFVAERDNIGKVVAAGMMK